MARRRVVAAAVILGLVIFLGAGGHMDRLFFVPTRGPTPPPRELGAESASFASRDGTRLSGWFIPAMRLAGADGRAPTIVHAHGNAGNVESHLWFSEFLPAAGFNLFIFDYRGYGESEGSARYRDDLIEDTHGAIDYVLGRTDVDPARIGLYGQSLGGAIALPVMAEREEIRAAVFVSAFTGWREIAADVLGHGRSGAISRSIARLLVRGSRRAIDSIAAIDRPILLVHGDSDEIVPVEHSKRLAAAARSAKLVVLPGGDHNSIRETNPEFDALVAEFFREHLGE